MLKRNWNIVFLGLFLLVAIPVLVNGGNPLLASGNQTANTTKSESKHLTNPKRISSNKNYSGMVRIRGGEFRMGSKFKHTIRYYNLCKKLDKRCKVWWFRDERPERNVFIGPFWIDKFEVTNQKYLEFVKATKHRPALDDSCKTNACKEGNLWDGTSFPNVIKNQPVIQVSWYDANTYCRWRGGRLPTEAEWEKAARGTTGFAYPWGNNSPTSNHATFKRKWRGVYTMTNVGSLQLGASMYGIFDMAGNVWEWVADWYELEYYKHGPKKNPKGPKEGRFKTVRGGSWVNNADVIHSAYRRWSRPEVRFNDTGFRCAKDETNGTKSN